MITVQRCFGGVRYLDGAGPSMANVAKLDAGAVPMIQCMARTGLQVDLAHFSHMETELSRDLERITEEVRQLTGVYCNLDSGDQKAELLFKTLGLKQARVKMTNSGSRESVEDAVLTAIQHDHPVVPMMLEYAELSKLRGTYVSPMPKLARRTSFGKWRMYPNFKTTRVPSGRLACSDPNLLAMPTRTERGREIRKGFITDPGWVYVSVDECLHPDTLVSTITGPRKISELEIGDKVLTHRDRRIKWGEVTRTSVIRPKPAWRLTFDNGESVIASCDHHWPTLSRWSKGHPSVIVDKTTAELTVGQRMVPCREGLTGSGYKTWYSKSSFLYDCQHHIVAEATYGPRPEGHHVHHIDEDRQNNGPNNLEYKLAQCHWSDHSKENYKKQDHRFRIEKLRVGIERRRTYNGSNNPNAKLTDLDREAIADLVSAHGWTATDVAQKFQLSYGHARRVVKKLEAGMNHTLIKKEFVGVQPMYAITVEPDHNYVLACGVVSQNSQIEVRVAAHRSKDTNLLGVYEDEQDVYYDFATSAFRREDKRYKDEKGWHYPTVDKDQHRRPAKTCVLAAIYDVTAGGLLEQMPIICVGCGKEATKHTCGHFRSLWNENNCQDIINAFYIRYPGLMRMRKQDHRRAQKHGLLWDDWGRILHTTAVRSVLDWVVSAALREAANFPIQSTAQGTVKVTMGAVQADLEQGLLDVVHPLLQVHDELLFEAREDVAQELGQLVAGHFEGCVRLDAPIKASVATAPTWGDLPK